MRVLLPANLRVSIKEDTMKFIHDAVMAAPGEVSGLAQVRRIGNGFYIKDAFCPKQINTSGTTEIDVNALSDMIIDMAKEKKDSEHWKVWWHSHGYMRCFFSYTDKDTINKFMKFGSKPFYLVSIVVNKFGEMLCRLDVRSFMRFTILEIPVSNKEAWNKMFQNWMDDPVDIDYTRRDTLLGRIVYPDRVMLGGGRNEQTKHITNANG